MTDRVWTDRSRIEAYQHCKRERWLTYHEEGTGIVSARKPLPLAVGGAVHVGLEHLLRGHGEEVAVAMAVEDLAQYRGRLEVDASERPAAIIPGMAAISPVPPVIAIDDFDAQLVAQARDLGMAKEDVEALFKRTAPPPAAAGSWDDWLWEEQSRLVEGLVRAYSRRRLAILLAEFEVLEVEREGSWTLHSDLITETEAVERGMSIYNVFAPGYEPREIMFMSRPDALLRSRADNSLYLLSYKTAASWDHRKEKDAQHDMQGLSEGVEVERRLGEWWRVLHWYKSSPETATAREDKIASEIPTNIGHYLISLPEPPRIVGIRYEYILKGERWRDKELSTKFGFDCRSQKSHLIRCYYNAKSSQTNWSWDFIKDDGSEGKLAWQNWKASLLTMPVKEWIDMLDAAEMAMSAYDSTVGMEPRELGYKCPAQASGYTKSHPLDEIFIPPITVYRSEDDLRDWLEQTESQERGVAEAVAQVREAGADQDAKRSRLNVLFPQTRRSCEYPSQCAYVPVCYGGEDIRANPMSSGLYQLRSANHPQERELAESATKEK